MVASQKAYRARAVAAALLTVSVILPLVPTTAAQGPLFDLEIRQGQVTVSQAGVEKHFFTGGESVTVTFRAYNKGTAVNNVPIYLWVAAPGGGGVAGMNGRCFSANFPETRGETRPGIYESPPWTFTVPANLAAGGHNVTVMINQRPSGFTDTYFRNVNGGTTCPETVTSVIDETANNVAYGYFVKDKRVNFKFKSIQWCTGEADALGCEERPRRETIEYPPPDEDYYTYFRATIVNDGSMADATNYGSACGGASDRTWDSCESFPYLVNFTLTGPGINGSLWLTPSAPLDTHVRDANNVVQHVWGSDAFSLVNRSGNYTVRAEIRYREDNSTADNVNMTWAFVHYADLFAQLGSGWATDPENPYNYTAGTMIGGNIVFINNGSRWVNNTVDWRAYIDKPTSAFYWTASNDSSNGIRGNGRWTIPVSKELALSEESDNYLTPGKHTLYIEVDMNDGVTELDESNNVLQIPIYLEDRTPPRFTSRLKLIETRSPTEEVEIDKTHPHKPFRVEINATDENRASLSLVANFTTDEAENATRRYPMSLIDGGNFTAVVSDLPLLGNGTSTNWTVEVEATDALGNRNVTAKASLRVDVWPLHLAPEDYLVRNPPQNASYNWSGEGGSEAILYSVFVRENMTGFSDQRWNDSNLFLEAVSPDKKYRQTHAADEWTEYQCSITEDGGINVNDPPLLKDGQPTTNYNCENAGTFNVTISKGSGAPGTWNVTIKIKDVSGMERVINRTFNVVDRVPIFRAANLSAGTIKATENVTLQARMYDDYDSGKVRVYANFTRNDGIWANFSMGPGTATGEAPIEHRFKLLVKTGRYQMLGMAGNYTVTFAAVDQNNNWAHDGPHLFNVSDGGRPSLITPGVFPELQEINTNVTFYARASDESNVTVQLTVLRRGTSEAVLGPVNMTEGPDGNFTYTANFSVENDYEWRIRAYDSWGHFTDPPATGPLTIRQNLGPRFEIRSPAAVIDGQRYAPGAPRIELLVYDHDGLDPSTITFLVDDDVVPHEILPGPAGIGGYLITYQVPQAQRYLHGATVTVNATAVDNSTLSLMGWSNFTFRVDDVSPVAQLAGFEPRHREDALHVWNVSMDTRFTITAHDQDGLPTKVESIRYRVYSLGQSSAEVVYAGPFRLADVPGITARPGTYQIQFFAEDSVGNINKELQTLTVYLDATPPSPDPFGSKPRDRDISMTIYDDRSGMDRAVVWYRMNNASYTFTSMILEGNAWRAQLPEGRKGDRISYYVQAWDRVNNTATFGTADEPYGVFLVPNHKPTLKITSPEADSIVNRRRDITWDSTDADGDALVFTISLKSPGGQAFSELTRIETPGTRRYAFDSTPFGDGTYALRIEATDGAEAVTQEVKFVIRNKVSPFGPITVGSDRVLPGEGVLIEAQITKASPISVEARVYESGSFVDSFAMNDAGERGDKKPGDGIWSVLVALDSAGDYRVDILTLYEEDGLEKNATQEGAALFSVAMTPGYILTEYAPMVALVALAGAVAVGVAGYVAIRSRGGRP